MVFAYLSWGVALLFAAIDWLAVGCHKRRLEYIFKPATLIALLLGAWVVTTRGPHDAWQARFFLPGLAFSLVGDVFLMLRGERLFLYGLVAFLLAHVCYIVGLNPTLPSWRSLPILLIVAVIGVVLYRGIAAGLCGRGESKLLLPVGIYSVALSLMLFSAWATVFRPAWSGLRGGLVIVGASLFFVSDAMLAWDRFVSPSPSARVRVMITYHLGQIALAASLAL